MTSMLGLAQGTRRDVVLSTRISVYKVQWCIDCHETSILHEFDDAVLDGVDILSVSLISSESGDNLNHYRDATCVPAFHDMHPGVWSAHVSGWRELITTHFISK